MIDEATQTHPDNKPKLVQQDISKWANRLKKTTAEETVEPEKSLKHRRDQEKIKEWGRHVEIQSKSKQTQNSTSNQTSSSIPKTPENTSSRKNSKEVNRNEVHPDDVKEWIFMDEEDYENGGTLLLSKEKIEDLRTLVSKGDMNEVIVHGHLKVTRKDLFSVHGKEWLNDVVIEEYCQMIAKQNPSIAVLTTYLYTKLTAEEGFEAGCKEAMNWVGEDLTKKELILIPVNYSSHWVLIKISNKEKLIYLYDSIIGTRKTSPVPAVIKKFIERYYEEKGNPQIFNIKKLHNIPTQNNALDCGVFLCMYAERIARNAWFDFHAKDIPKLRWKLIWEIKNGVLKENVSYENEQAKILQQPEQRKSKPPEKNQNRDEIFIKWPAPNSKEWVRLEEDLTKLLSTMGGSPEDKAESHPKVIYSICLERFGEKKEKKGYPSRRQTKSMKLRAEVNDLKSALQGEKPQNRTYLQKKLEEKVHLLRLQKRAEGIGKRRRKMKQNTREFYQHPYNLARRILDPEIKGKLESSKEEVEQFLHNAHSDSNKNIPLEDIEGLFEYPEPQHEYDSSLPTWKEFNEVLRKARTKSAPGPNGVPYKLYKNCPGVARILFEYIKGLWRKNKIPPSWRRANGTLIPKENGATSIEKFRTISLLNVEGKIFFKLKADKITKYMLQNQYIDTNIQKGGVPGVSGCLEHTALVSQMIKEAIRHKEDLVNTWLDIRNAYGSIPHKVIKLALERTHLPPEVINLIGSYYSDVQIRFTTKNFTTNWQKVEKGIITGCTLSVILFALTMTMIVMSTKKETKGPVVKSGQQQENSRLYMDDITTSTRTVAQANHLLEELSKFFRWAGLEVRPDKCRAMVIKKGKVVEQQVYYNGQALKSIKEKPIKYLGKVYNKTCKDKEQIDEMVRELDKSLKKIDKQILPGRCKAWILEKMLLPRIMWPISIYDIPMSKIESMQAKITSKLKKWLGLPQSLSTNLLYSKSGMLQLPYSSLVEEAKVCKVRNLAALSTSKDQGVRGAKVNLDAGRKWKASEEHQKAISSLKMQDIAGIANKGREGLGLEKRQYYQTSSDRQRRTLISKKVRESEEERRKVESVKLAQQGASMKWNTKQKELKQQEVLSMAENRLKFIVKSVYDLLATPANKNRWFNTEEHRCVACGQEGTLSHILAGCKVALSQGRYTWRHNKVLKEISYWVEERRKDNNNQPPTKPSFINFVKAGEKGTTSNITVTSFLNSARDWKLQVDLGRRVKIPEYIMATQLKPDLILTSDSTKQMVVMELTVPLEDRIEISAELKKSKYEQLITESAKSNWKTNIYTVEVGCRGFAASSLSYFLKDLGYVGKEKTKIIKKVEYEAERASNNIWNWSHMKTWGTEEPHLNENFRPIHH